MAYKCGRCKCRRSRVADAILVAYLALFATEVGIRNVPQDPGAVRTSWMSAIRY
jgi:hypothetical protein